MFTAVCLCNSYVLLLGCATSWESCHAYYLYTISYAIFTILVDMCVRVRVLLDTSPWGVSESRGVGVPTSDSDPSGT